MIFVVMEFDEAKRHLHILHGDANGYITIAKKEGFRWKQYHLKPEKLNKTLADWLGESFKDIYFSQNTFFLPQRKIEHIRQLRNLFVDVDCYLLNYTPDWVLKELDETVFERNILPVPNLIIFSGRGIVVIWRIYPKPKAELPLWNTIQDYFGNRLKSLGGDLKALDAARVFRLAGTENSKNGEIVHVEYRHDKQYELHEIRDRYVKELTLPVRKKCGRKTKLQRMHWIRTLHFDRLNDLVKLAEIRNYEMVGYRETTLFLYRYWQCCFLNDEKEALRHTLDFNAMFAEPLTEREVVNATLSAKKAWEARSDKEANRIAREKGYPGAGYNVGNKKLIEWLGITEDEQQHLKTIIGWREKRKRDRGYQEREKRRKETERREAGMMPRQDYLEKAEERCQKALELRAQGLTQKEIAMIVGVNQSTISRWLKK